MPESAARTVGGSDEPPALAPRLYLRGHIEGLDALRGIAVFMVLLFHAFFISVPWITWKGLGRWLIHLTGFGSLGVQLFFILSGFLITGILLDKVADPGYYRSFYIRRGLRILPAYMLTLVAIRVFKGVPWNYILACVLFIANMPRLVGANTFEYGALWSLAVEEQFYLVWPWLIRRLSRKDLLRLIVCIAVASPLLRAALALFSIDTYYKTWDNLDYLLYGALVALAIREGSLNASNIRPLARGLLAFAAIFLIPATVSAMYEETFHWVNVVFNSVGRIPFLALFTGILLFMVASHSERRGVRRGRPGAMLRIWSFLGTISYGLYLVHSLVFYLFDKWTLGTRFGRFHESAAILDLRAAIAVAISIGLATLSRRYYEQPFLELKGRLDPPSAPRPLTGLPAAVPGLDSAGLAGAPDQTGTY